MSEAADSETIGPAIHPKWALTPSDDPMASKENRSEIPGQNHQLDAATKREPESCKSSRYRKSELSLNHIIGCPLDCSYCVRHLYGKFDQRTPQALMSDEEAFQRFINHRWLCWIRLMSGGEGERYVRQACRAILIGRRGVR